MARTQQHFTIHTGLTVPPQRLIHAEQEYLVAPVIMIVEGVLNQGYVPGDEIAQCNWNGMPLVVNHPYDATGVPLSANDPDVLQAQGVGRIYRTQMRLVRHQDHTLTRAHAELWIDTAKVQALGGDAAQSVQMLESQTPLEVSTGFYSELDEQHGTFYGTPYTAIHRNLRADHLALLPNGIGACDFARGCGAPRLNHQEGCGASCVCDTCQRSPMETPPQTGWKAFVAALKQFVQGEEAHPVPAPQPKTAVQSASEEDQRTAVMDMATGQLRDRFTGELIAADDVRYTHFTPSLASLHPNRTDNDIRQALYSALAIEMGQDYTPIFIETIDSVNQSFTYAQGERLRQRSWEMDEDVLKLADDAQDVQRDTHYIPVDPAPVVTQAQKDVPMTTPVVSPIAIKARVNALIADPLTTWKEKDRPGLEGLSEAMLIRLEHEPKVVPVVATPAPQPPATMEEAVATMPEHLRSSMARMVRQDQARKTAAIAALIANKGNPFTQEKLQTMEIEELEGLVAGFAGVDYSGQGLPAPRVTPEVREQPPAPPDVLGGAVARQKAMGLR